MNQTIDFFVTNTFGRIIRRGVCPRDMVQLQASNEGEVALDFIAPLTFTHYQNGSFVSYGEQPSDYHLWSDAEYEWVLQAQGLEKMKADMRGCINDARDLEEANGFLAYGKWFDSDKSAIQRISVAAQAAQSIGSAFTIEWTCADNSVITLDYDQMINLPLIMAQAANTLHIKARDLKAQIELANSIEELNLITW